MGRARGRRTDGDIGGKRTEMPGLRRDLGRKTRPLHNDEQILNGSRAGGDVVILRETGAWIRWGDWVWGAAETGATRWK
jgi:hypothetical protein